MLRLPDESFDGSPRRSILDTFDFFNVVESAGEGYRELELDSFLTNVDACRSSSVDLGEVEARLREVDRESGK